VALSELDFNNFCWGSVGGWLVWVEAGVVEYNFYMSQEKKELGFAEKVLLWG
jgi:hypothetical protein